MDITRPMQLMVNHRVLEQDRRFYFTVSATLGICLSDGREQLDALYLKDAFEGNPDDPPLMDVGFPKPCGEFVVSGSFHAPGGIPVRGGEVRARIGDIEKQLYVFGKRQWKNEFPTEPEKFTALPLIYQNAFGGEGYEMNPVGKGFKDALLPMIEYPKALVGSKKDTPVPACFSPLDMMDPRRMQYKGTYGLDYKEKYFPGHPKDMDWKLFMLTPEDQWHKGFFTGDEPFVLENMHPREERIEGRLPGLIARCFIRQKKESGDVFGEIPLNLDTVWFIPEKMLGLLIFRGVIEVADDEAEEVTHILGAYEYRSQEPQSLSYYQAALDKRITGKDPMARFLTTSDLIPQGHKCAMELFIEMGSSEKNEDNALAENAKAKSDAMHKLAEKKLEEAVLKAEKGKDGKEGISIRDLMKKAKENPESDPDFTALEQKMEEILPGLASGDIKKIDWKNFSFDKLEQVSQAAQVFGNKKKKDANAEIEKRLADVKAGLQKQIDELDGQIQACFRDSDASPEAAESIRKLTASKTQLEEKMGLLKIPGEDEKPPEQPLPRVDTDEILKNVEKAFILPPGMTSAMQHVAAQKVLGIEDDASRALEAEVQEAQKDYDKEMEAHRQTVKEQLAVSRENFKKGYFINAHFMEQGFSPHKIPIETVREIFLGSLAQGQQVSDRDWACLDLAGQNLEGIDLSGAFLEQVNFKDAVLRNADLTGANLARACLDGADLSGAKMACANIGAVSGIDTDFSGADLTGAYLSKGHFERARFTNAKMEEIEAMDVNFTDSDLSGTRFYVTFFMNSVLTGVNFTGADVELCMFIKPKASQVNFSDTVFNRCAFIDARFDRVCFDRCDLSNSAFAATSPEESSMENLSFKKGKFFQTNLMNMNLKQCNFKGADISKAFFWNSDLTGADLSDTMAEMAQFRKSKLTRAVLDRMNMPRGSLAKAHLTGASFKDANLYQADFLRSTITNTDFKGANLDFTLIENWRPK